jgi:hypothetical protein
MRNKKLDRVIQQMENYLECWKQFNNFVNLARGKKFGPEDENQFLEIKSIITQEVEMIFAAMDVFSPTREDVLSLISSAPSLRYLSEMHEGNVRSLESQWHKIYIGWHSILGQLKVKQMQLGDKSLRSSMFGGDR